MKNILWLGNPFFYEAVAKLDWNVHYCNFPGVRVFSWAELTQRAGFIPDVLVVSDKSRPPFAARIENFPCLTVFLCVDSHIHSWYPRYAQAFDLCAVSLRDHLPMFRDPASCLLDESRTLWSPPYAKDEDLPPVEPVDQAWDLLFVGKVDPESTPRRKAFLDALKTRVPGLVVQRGDYRELYPKAKVVLNIAERGDLNFRVFEAPGTGACMLTPEIGHGLSDLFTPDEDLVLYRFDDVEHAAEQTRRLLADPERRRGVAASGLARVNAAHRAAHRAQSFAEFITGRDRLIEQRLAAAKAVHADYLRLLYLHWASAVADENLRAAYLKLSRYAPGLEL